MRDNNVKTLYQSVEKWFEQKQEIFKENMLHLKNIIINLAINNSSFH